MCLAGDRGGLVWQHHARGALWPDDQSLVYRPDDAAPAGTSRQRKPLRLMKIIPPGPRLSSARGLP
jgi:hypothetical protein